MNWQNSLILVLMAGLLASCGSTGGRPGAVTSRAGRTMMLGPGGVMVDEKGRPIPPAELRAAQQEAMKPGKWEGFLAWRRERLADPNHWRMAAALSGAALQIGQARIDAINRRTAMTRLPTPVDYRHYPTETGARDYGSWGYGATRVGDTYYVQGRDGTHILRGTTWQHPDGTTSRKIGNTWYNSDGSSTSQIGNTYYHSDGHTTTKIGNTWFRN